MKLFCKKTPLQKEHERKDLYRRLCKEVGDHKTETKFLWLPKQLFNLSRDCMETRWLERASIDVELKCIRMYRFDLQGKKDKPGSKAGARYVFKDKKCMFKWVETEWKRNVDPER